MCTCDGSSKNDCDYRAFYSATLTPRAIIDHAYIGEPYYLTAKGELLFKGGTVPHSRLLRPTEPARDNCGGGHLFTQKSNLADNRYGPSHHVV